MLEQEGELIHYIYIRKSLVQYFFRRKWCRIPELQIQSKNLSKGIWSPPSQKLTSLLGYYHRLFFLSLKSENQSPFELKKRLSRFVFFYSKSPNLASNPVLLDSINEKRKSFVGFLPTLNQFNRGLAKDCYPLFFSC